MLLTTQERKQLAELVVEQAAGRVNVIVHTGSISTAETVELSVHAKEIGADGISVITPYFFSYDDDALFEHYRAVAQAVDDLPVSLYCFPNNGKQLISTRLVRRLLEAALNIRAIKFSSVDLIQFQEYVEAGEGFYALCGVDAITLAARAAGAAGQVSGNSNVFPEPFRKLFEAFDRGDIAEARRQQSIINRIRAVLKDDIAHFKAAMAFRGLPVGGTRAPILSTISPAELDEMHRKFKEIGLLDGN